MNDEIKQYFNQYINKIGIENFNYKQEGEHNYIVSTFYCGLDYASESGFESDAFKSFIDTLMYKVSKYEELTEKSLLIADDIGEALLLVEKNFSHSKLFELLKKTNLKLTDEQHWQLIIDTWTMQEFNTYNGKDKVWRKIFNLKKPIKKLTEKLPEKFTAYRAGEQNGFSWTLSKDKAMWFCNRFKEQFGNIPFFEREFTRDDALFYTYERNEKEVVILS